MANLQIKGMDDDIYAELGKVAAAENRSISQQVLFLIKGHLARRKSVQRIPTPAETLLKLSGSWEGGVPVEDVIAGIRKARRNSTELEKGF